MSLGEHFSCGVDASSRVYCWGRSRFGELGISDEADLQRSLPSGPLRIRGNVAELRSSRGSTCARLENGRIECWGNNFHGQLGDGTNDNRTTPVEVVGISDAESICMGHHHTCAIRERGTLWCWGENLQGQLGVPGIDESHTPVEVTAVWGVADVACGEASTCILREDGAVYCWGTNQEAELGQGVTAEALSMSATPRQVHRIGGDVAEIEGYWRHYCVRRTDGRVVCWGRQEPWNPRVVAARAAARVQRDVSLERPGDYGWPRLVEGVENVTAISVGVDYSCAVEETGHVYCWGRNDWANIGNGSVADRDVPSPVSGIIDAERVITGTRTGCAIRSIGVAECWGINRSGQVGNGSTNVALVPSVVLAPIGAGRGQ